MSCRATRCSPSIQKYLGITLLPQAGVALGMAAEAAELSDGHMVRNVVLFSVLVYELVGPTLTKLALTAAGEIIPEGDAQKGYDALYGLVWGGRFSVAVAGADWVDIMNPGVHKGAALLQLGERLGVPPEGMMAFGDTFNDAEMLKAAKYGFLVENGSPALREEVPFLAPPNTSSGVMQVLRRVLAQNGRVCESDFRRAK